MKKKGSFLAGIVTTLMVFALGTTALAASGKVTFNFSNIAVDGKVQITAGTTITAPNGQQVPGSILYVDEAGGKTNYLPIRAISDLLGVEIGYDSATKTVYLGEQPELPSASAGRWTKEVEGRKVTYSCGEEGHSYSEPLKYRPTWMDEGWGLSAISHDTRNYATKWEYENGDSTIWLHCAYPSTAGFASHMSSADAVNNCQTVTIQGYPADYYDDGISQELFWEDSDGVLFWVSGNRVSREDVVEVAESVTECTAAVEPLDLGWLPSGAHMMDYYKIADTVMEYWVLNNVAMSFTCSAEPSGLPNGTPKKVEVNDVDAEYWDAEEPYVDSQGTTTVNGQKVDSIGGLTGFTVPSSKRMNTLAWRDPETGTYCRLQSILDMDTMIRIAENVQ